MLGSYHWAFARTPKAASGRRAQKNAASEGGGYKMQRARCQAWAALQWVRYDSYQKRSAVEGKGGVALAEDAYSFELADRSKWFE